MQITEELAQKLIKNITEDINMYVTAHGFTFDTEVVAHFQKVVQEKKELLAELQISYLAL